MYTDTFCNDDKRVFTALYIYIYIFLSRRRSCSREFKSGDYECAGTMIIYTHPEPDKEVVEMKGPISEDIEIQVW